MSDDGRDIGTILEFDCDFCDSSIDAERYRWSKDGGNVDACAKCFELQKEELQGKYSIFNYGEAERSDFEAYFETRFRVIVDLGMYPYAVTYIPTHTCDEDYDRRNPHDNEIDISNERFYPESPQGEDLIVDFPTFELILDIFDVSAPHEVPGLTFLTNEITATDAAKALVLCCENYDWNTRRRIVQSFEAFTNTVAQSFAKLEIPDLSSFTASDIARYLKQIFQSSSDHPLDGALAWLGKLTDAIHAVDPLVSVRQFFEPFVGEMDLKNIDIDQRQLRIKFSHGESKSIILQIAPEYRGWNCVQA